MTREELFKLMKHKKSFLCVGLDSDITKIPIHLLDCEDPVFEFNKQIIDATIEFTIAYKPNLAFYECRGVKGMQSLEKTIQYLNKFNDQVFTIADAKRGDIGNTSKLYAKSFFGNDNPEINFDAVTVAPYMGEDSVSPFLEYKNKWVILLALTSNKGAENFQFFSDGKIKLYEQVLEKSRQWGNADNMMYVVGATQAQMLKDIRKIVPDHFLLVPGIGAQGGDLEEVAKFGLNKQFGLIVNASRSIIFASKGIDFSNKAKEEAWLMQKNMQKLMNLNN
jgi:orotidine-5'-phosphate decarboxylase